MATILNMFSKRLERQSMIVEKQRLTVRAACEKFPEAWRAWRSGVPSTAYILAGLLVFESSGVKHMWDPEQSAWELV